MHKITITVAILLTALAVACSRNAPGPQMTATPAVINCAAAEVPEQFPADAKHD